MKSMKRRWLWFALVIVMVAASAVVFDVIRQRRLTAFDHLERSVGARQAGHFAVSDRHLEMAREALPHLESLENFRSHRDLAQELLSELHMPVLPDLEELDDDGQKLFYRLLTDLRQRPDQAKAYGRLGLLCEAQLMPDQAAAFYRRAVELAPGAADWHYQFGNLLETIGDPEGAAIAFRRSAELEPTYAPVWLRMAWLEADPAVALAHSDRYIELRPADAFGLVSRAAFHHAAGRWTEMGEDLQRAVQLGPIGTSGHRLIAASMRHLGRDDDAEFHTAMSQKRLPGGTLDDPLAARPKGLVTYTDPDFTRFFALVGSGRCAEGLALAEDLLAKHKNDPRNHGRLCAAVALCHYRSRKYDEAEGYAIKARQAFPEDPPILALVGLIHLNQGRLDDALTEVEALLEGYPDSTDGLHLRALAEISLAVRQDDPIARVERAIADLERCVVVDPVNVEFLKVLASAHAMLEHWQEAERIIAQALRVSPQDPGLRSIETRIRARATFWPQS